MNKVFKVKWNAALKRFDVTSELTKGKTKSNTNKSKSLRDVAISSLGSLFITLCSSAMADDIELVDFTPEEVAEVMIIKDKKTLTSTSGKGFSTIASGQQGFENTTLGDLISRGVIIGSADLPSVTVESGSTVSESYIDPTTGNVVSFKAYDNNQLKERSLADFEISASLAVGENGQYVGRNLIQIAGGGELDVSLGESTGDWKNNPVNRLNIILKGIKNNPGFISSVFKLSATGTDDNSLLDYHSKTVVSLGNIANVGNLPNEALSTVASGYSGSFSSALGQQNVNSLDELKNYNNALIQAVKEGVIKSSQYDTQFRLAYGTVTKYIFADYKIPDNDAVLHPIDKNIVAYILAEGNKNTINIASDAEIQLWRSDASIAILRNGSTLNNQGHLSTLGNSVRGSYVIKASGSQINNYGVIDAGSDQNMIGLKPGNGFSVVNPDTLSTGISWGIVANANSTVVNEGVINVAARQKYSSNIAVQLVDSTLVNNGNINVSATSEPLGVASANAITTGVQVLNASTFTNNGTVYSGREAQTTTDQAVADLAVSRGGNRLVDVRNTSRFTNTRLGELIIGSLSQGVIAVVSSNAGSHTLNEGKITLNGATVGSTGNAPLQNIGMLATSGATDVVNTGTVTLAGTNAVGMQALADVKNGLGGQLTNSGIIDITGGIDPIFKTANVGMWSEGAMTKAINAGIINLNGTGSIAAHARDGGSLEVASNGGINFSGGSNQTGYYVFGAGSTLHDNSSGIQSVNTENSTLYRIDGGASFSGSGSQAEAEASGKNSSALLVTSLTEQEKSSLISGTMKLDITGEGATGITVAGSAQGTLSAETDLELTGIGSTAGIVDGKYTDIQGKTQNVGSAKLTSLATLTSGNAAASAMGYIARNGGTLDHQGSIDFSSAGSTGVLVDGGTLNNSGDISVNGTAVNIQGMDSAVTNSGTVNATDGVAAFLVGNNASLDLNGSGTVRAGGSAHGVLLDTGAQGLRVEGAVIDMAPSGTGNGIENRAEVQDIQLNNTTVNVGNGIGVRTATSLAQTNSGLININGSGTGLYFGHADGSATAGDLDTSTSQQLVINVNDAAGNGVVTNTSGKVLSGVSVNINDSAGGAALVVGGSTQEVVQSGVLKSASTTTAVVDVDNGTLAQFTNSGIIEAADKMYDAIKVTLGSNIAFTNLSGGHITGKVDLSDGNNTVRLQAGSTANAVITGDGNDNYYLDNITAGDANLFDSLQAGAGSDTLNLNHSELTVTDAGTLSGFEKVSLTQGSQLNLDGTLFALGDAQDDGTGTDITLDGTSTLTLSGNANTAFASHIKGSGTLATDLAGQAFDFTTNNASNSFSGTLDLANATFALSAQNTQALTGATLRAGSGSVVTVGNGVQKIGGLAFDGGIVRFDTGNPGDVKVSTSIAAQKMDLTGHGIIEISAGTVDHQPQLPPDRLSILEQDDANIQMQLASSASPVIGDGGNLVLKDQYGTVITDTLNRDVMQNGVQVANATYDYRLTSGQNSDGLYVNYGLTQLDLQGQGGDALSLHAAGKTGNAADLSAKLTGTGDLAIDTGAAGTVTLSNSDNDYQGQTFIRSGNLAMLNDNVLGQTSTLDMSANTGLAMNGHRQSVGAVSTAAGSLIDLDGGNLTVKNGGTLEGHLTGAGMLNLTGGLLNITGDNGSFTAITTIASTAQAMLNSAAGLGQGNIVNEGILGFTQASGSLVNSLSGSGEVNLQDGSELVLTGNNSGFDGHFALNSGNTLSVTGAESLGTASVGNDGALNILTTADWTLTNSVTGSGSLNKNGAGIMSVTQDAANYTGTTAVNGGGVLLGSAESSVTLASGQTDVAAGALFGGFGGTAGNLNNAGSLVVGAPLASATLFNARPSATTFNVGNNLTNSGHISIGQTGSGVVGNQLVVAGDYHGDGGSLHFNTALGDDRSATDHMTVEGSTSGVTSVSVNNAGGLGGQTLNGIELIHVQGASEGEFTQQGRIVAGAYDYLLARGQGDNAAHWFLTSSTDDGGDPVTDPDKETVVLITRPESGAYASNMAAANTLFTSRLHDRLGETHYVDALTGEEKVTSMWIRNVGGHNRSTDSTGQLKTQANRWVTQLGGDVAQWTRDGTDRFHLGVMAGYANQHSSTRNTLSGHRAKSGIEGYSTGVYATWLQDNAEKTGAYVDSWAQYSWFNNTVNGDTLKSESYTSKGFTASVEAGYTWKLGEASERESYYLQPKAQMTWMGVKADSLNEDNGTHVSGNGDGNIQTRLGVRAFIKGHSKSDDDKQRTFEPFVEANWIANTKNFGSTLNGVNVSQRGTKNIGELKVGVEGQINPALNLWGNIGQQMGAKGYSDSNAMVGVKVNF